MSAVTAQDRYTVGLRLFRSGTYELAERTLKDAIALDPRHGPSHALLALTLHYLGRYSEALTASSAALAIRPDVDALRARALASIEMGLSTAAVTAATDAVALMPASPWAHHTLGWACERAKRFDQAEEHLQRGADLARSDMNLRADYGRFLIRRRRLRDAEAVAALIPSHVDSQTVLLLRGEIALWRNRNQEARDHALWILSRNARNRPALTLLTLATANRKPLLKLWWRHTQIVAFKPRWMRVAWLGLVIAAGVAARGFPMLFMIYLAIAREHVKRQVAAELKQVRLAKSF